MGYRKYPLIKTGDKRGSWLALANQHPGDIKLLCRCTECGRETMVIINSMNTGNSLRCYKCGIKKKISKTNACIKVGDKFSHWTVIENLGKRILCECDCRNKTRRKLRGSDLLHGKTKSCGCSRSERFSENQQRGKNLGQKIMGAIYAAGLAPSYDATVRKNSNTGVTGVCFNKKNGRYRAYITVDRRQIHLGEYETLKEAVEARLDGEEKYFSDRRRKVEEIKNKFMEENNHGK